MLQRYKKFFNSTIMVKKIFAIKNRLIQRGTLCVLGWSLSPVLMLCTIVFPALHHSVSIGELEYKPPCTLSTLMFYLSQYY